MSLDRLPEELLIIVIRQLDVKSLHNLYDVGNHHIQNVIRSKGVVKTCKFSMNTMATAKSLKLDFFTNIATYLQELDLSYVQDLKKTSLLPVMRKLKNLITLNVAYTCITIIDLLDCYELCPTIKNITVDYQFHKTGKLKVFPQELLERCQNVFQNFVNVHFVGSQDNLMNSELPKIILEKANLNHLIFTVVKVDKMFTFYKHSESKPVLCNKFSLFCLHWRKDSLFEVGYECPKIIQEFPFEYEYIHVSEVIFCSEMFKRFFSERFQVEVKNEHVSPLCKRYIFSQSNVAVMIWNKQTTEFDESFFSNLYIKLQCLFPSIRTLDHEVPELPVTRDAVCVRHPLLLSHDNNEKPKEEPITKKRRVAASSIKLDYDELVKDLQRVELSVSFYDHVRKPVTLSNDSAFLKKLTFLSLAGSVRYSAEFFNILFRCCENLITLNIEAPSVSPCISPISRSIPLSRSVQNLRITDKKVDFQTLFSSLSQTKSLVNLEVHDKSHVHNNLASPDIFFKQCPQLCKLSLHLHVMLSESVKAKKLKMLNEAKEKFGLHHLYIELLCEKSDIRYTYDPSLDVFRLSQIKVIV